MAARGLDIDDIDTVIQFSVRHVDALVHRTGRTGRAGKKGRNVVFTSKMDLPFLMKCEKSLKINFSYRSALTQIEDEELKQERDRAVEKIKLW